VCVYGSSRFSTPSKYLQASKELGKILADGGHLCINGGGKSGCMGALNDGVIESGGKVRGVILKKFVVEGEDHSGIQDMVIVEGNDLQNRKKFLVEDADCVIALPGGTGTWDEVWEAVCLNGLGLQQKPICLINIDGFYDRYSSYINLWDFQKNAGGTRQRNRSMKNSSGFYCHVKSG